MEADTVTWLNTKEAAEHLGVSPRTLEHYRYVDEGPAFVKRGRVVRYKLSQLDGWMSGEDRTTRAC